MSAALFTVLTWIAAPLFAFASWVAQPASAVCPVGTYVMGVRPSGLSSCVRVPAGRGERECVRGGTCGPWQEDDAWSLPVRIYCHGATSPRVLNDRRIGCRLSPGRDRQRRREHVANGDDQDAQ